MATETMEPGFEFCFNSDKFKRPHEASGTALYSTGQSSCKAETSPVHRRPRVTGRAAFLTAGLAWRRGRWGPLKKAVSRTDRPGGSRLHAFLRQPEPPGVCSSGNWQDGS